MRQVCYEVARGRGRSAWAKLSYLPRLMKAGVDE